MADLNFQLLKWQQQVITDKTRFKVVCAGRRCGKSRLAATMLLIYGLRCPKGSAVMYVAPTMGQARTIIWQVLLDIGREVIQSSHVNNLEITLINGATIYVRGSDRPDTLRGVSLTFVVLDEYADMKSMVWEQIIRASLSDKKGMLYLSEHQKVGTTSTMCGRTAQRIARLTTLSTSHGTLRLKTMN